MKKNKNYIAVVIIAICAIIVNHMNYTECNVLSAMLIEYKEYDNIGASMPYTRYESTAAQIGGGAEFVKSDDFDENNIASQASEQSYIKLPNEGSYAQWAMETTGDGITMRFTMPDTEDGMGQNGSLDIYVNNKKVTTVNLTSYYMWQYFEAPNNANPTGSPLDEPTEGAMARFVFDEIHFKLNEVLEIGDVIRVVNNGENNIEYGVDFIEIEQVPDKIEKPDNAYSATDFGADGTDEEDDYDAIKNCIDAANQDGKDVYIPEGYYKLSKRLSLNVSGIKITGAGMWYTNLQFTQSEIRGGGIVGNKASNVELCHMYINSYLRSRYVEKAAYKCISDNWCNNSYIHHIWEDHFECGIWLGDYIYEDDAIDYSDGIVIEDCRLRNNFADGVNFCQGTSNAIVRNCSVRNNGDDGLAMWNNNSTNTNIKDEENNTFCNNTVELIWRASGIAVFGGNGHKIYNNYISDNFMSSGIRLNTTFAGHKFNNTDLIVFSNNIIVRCGSSAISRNDPCGAIDISGNVMNITFENTYIYDAQHDGIEISDNSEGIVFNNTSIYGTGIDGNISNEENGGAAINTNNLSTGINVKFYGIELANIAYENLIYGREDSVIYSDKIEYVSNYSYKIPLGTSNIITIYNLIEPTTEAPTTEEITTEGPITQESTTQKSTEEIPTSEVTPPDITKVKSATRNNVSKKVKLSIKKIKGARGYKVQISKKKKFNKKNILVTKVVKKANVTITDKRLKKAKKLYVRVMAYNFDGKNEIWAKKWSKVKKIKIYK